MKGFVKDIEGLAVKNLDFRQVLYTAKHCQLVVMALKPKEEIGAEVHKLDQFFRVEEGSGEASESPGRRRPPHPGRGRGRGATASSWAGDSKRGARATSSHSVVLPSKCSWSASASARVWWTTPSR